MRVSVVDMAVLLVGERDDFTKEAHLNEGARFTGLSASACCWCCMSKDAWLEEMTKRYRSSWRSA